MIKKKIPHETYTDTISMWLCGWVTIGIAINLKTLFSQGLLPNIALSNLGTLVFLICAFQGIGQIYLYTYQRTTTKSGMMGCNILHFMWYVYIAMIIYLGFLYITQGTVAKNTHFIDVGVSILSLVLVFGSALVNHEDRKNKK